MPNTQTHELLASMASMAELVESLEQYDDIVSWINDTLTPSADDSFAQVSELTELEQHITHLVATLDIACEDTSSQLERIIDDVSRGVPRLTYGLHFMRDGASALQNTLIGVHQRSRDAVPHATSVALDRLQQLDTAKRRMEAARDVLREAESWSTLELEVTSLLTERSYAKAAERLSEASKSMAVFQNTPEYDPRRTLMVSLQNQLEASLSSALVAAINTQDVAICRDYFSIFSNIQRESEFRNYYNASRRTSIIVMWRDAHLLDCDSASPSPDSPAQSLLEFLPRFYATFLSLLNAEKTSLPFIFPDPALTLSTFISSTLSALQPTFSQRLSSLFEHVGDSSLVPIISAFRATEEFAVDVEKVMKNIKYSPALPSAPEGNNADVVPLPSLKARARRRSSRMSISWRPGQQKSSPGASNTVQSLLDVMDWEQELFQPFIDFQIGYGALERRFLEYAFHAIITDDPRGRVRDPDRARLLRERAVDIFGVAEGSLTRCTSFTHGYGAAGLVDALDGFFQSFIDTWTADIRSESPPSSIGVQSAVTDSDLLDLDYTTQDWIDFQGSLHLLAAARTVFERTISFETKLRSNLAQTATQFRLARNDPATFMIAHSKGESLLLEQSSLNSVELNTLLNTVEADMLRESHPTLSVAGLRQTNQSGPTEPLLADARKAVFTFARACQISLQGTILSPLRKHLASYASSPQWTTPGDPKLKHTLTANDLQVPSFSLSPSDTVQRVAEGLLNLPRLFEVYADDDALSFSLHTLPCVDLEIKGDTIAGVEVPVQHGHMRRASLSLSKTMTIDPEAVSSAWLSSLGHTLLEHLTASVLPNITTLSMAGAAQLSSDLEYLSNIVRALNVESEGLEVWRKYTDMDDEDGRKALSEGSSVDTVLQTVARMRSWSK